MCLLLVGCGGKPATSTDGTSGNTSLPDADASTVSVVSGGDIGGELDTSDVIDSNASQGATTTTQGSQGEALASAVAKLYPKWTATIKLIFKK